MARVSPWAERLAAAGQAQVLRHWADLSDAERDTLDAQIAEVEARVGLSTLGAIVTGAAAAKQDDEIQPPAEGAMGDASNEEERVRWEASGYRLVAQGRCAAVVMAGGQGSRLGSTFPKGILGDAAVSGADIGLPSGLSLFGIQAARLLRVQAVAAERFPEEAKAAAAASVAGIPFLVMTSDATHERTQAFFEERGYFGLQPEQVRFFKQGRMPALDADGKMLLATKGSLCMSPDGNGGIYPALEGSGALGFLAERGVSWVQVFSVDNILIKAADPVYYGFCEERGCDASAKTAIKADASEAVGVFACRGGAYGVIEYSEIGRERSELTDSKGGLLYGAANLAIHCYSLDFLKGPAIEYCSRATVWHKAVKDIATVDGQVKGTKLEAFIFDAFAESKNFGLLKVSRAVEFSAIKNSDDKPRDTPKTAVAALSALHTTWLKAAGVDTQGRAVEVHPSVSFAGEGLEDVARRWADITGAQSAEGPVLIA